MRSASGAGFLSRCRRSSQLRERQSLPPTYAHTGTAVVFIISELPGERAEAFFIEWCLLSPNAAFSDPFGPYAGDAAPS
jgi:hypothetical protein